MSDNASKSSGIGILGILQIIFIVLKLLDVITWSWLIVFIPAYIVLGTIALMLLIFIIVSNVTKF